MSDHIPFSVTIGASKDLQKAWNHFKALYIFVRNKGIEKWNTKLSLELDQN